MANKSNNKVAKDVKKNSKDKRRFMKDFKAELKKVVWPTPKQLLNNTAAVITIVIIVTLIVFILDLGFKALNSKGINQLRTIIDNTTEQVNEVSTEENTVENQTDVNTTVEQNNTVVENQADANTTVESTNTTTENTAE